MPTHEVKLIIDGEQMIDMAKTIKDVHEAIVRGKPVGELLRRSNKAVKACCGFAI